MPQFIFTPIGISLFTKLLRGQEPLLNQHSNDNEDEIPGELKRQIANAERTIQLLFKQDNFSVLKLGYAELNSLLRFYGDNFDNRRRDEHFLVAIGTYIPKKAADKIKRFFNNYFEPVIIFCPPGLSTRSKEHFYSGIKELLKCCDEYIKQYKEYRYEIVFNLTDRFKSLQGHLNIIGMYNADMIIYIFETTEEIITIPRIPLLISDILFKNIAGLFLQFSQTNTGIERIQFKEIPEAMIEQYDNDKYILSDRGNLIWNNIKKDILANLLIDLPLIQYSRDFINDFLHIDRYEEKKKLQETIAFMRCRLQENRGDISILQGSRSGGILFDNYAGINNRLAHFRVNQDMCVSCRYKNNLLTLRYYGHMIM